MFRTLQVRDLSVSNQLHQPQSLVLNKVNVHQLITIDRLNGQRSEPIRLEGMFRTLEPKDMKNLTQVSDIPSSNQNPSFQGLGVSDFRPSNQNLNLQGLGVGNLRNNLGGSQNLLHQYENPTVRQNAKPSICSSVARYGSSINFGPASFTLIWKFNGKARQPIVKPTCTYATMYQEYLLQYTWILDQKPTL